MMTRQLKSVGKGTIYQPLLHIGKYNEKKGNRFQFKSKQYANHNLNTLRLQNV